MAFITLTLAGCAESTEQGTGDNNQEPAREDGVIVTMPATSEPEAGFDPAYGWGAGSMYMSL